MPFNESAAISLAAKGFDSDTEEPDIESRELGDDQLDTDRNHPTTPDQLNAAEKRRAQSLKFEKYVSQQAERRILSSDKVKEILKNKDDEDLDIRSLLAKQETKHLTDPREYQLELFERAKQENIIAVLDTGSGKTLIAVLLLRHTIDQELEHRAKGNPKKVSFFLVQSVTLAFQQASVLETNLDSKVLRLYGAMGDSLESSEFWKQATEKNMVIVSTAAILHNALIHSLIRMDQINLLIFDEAHHAKKNHSYAMIIHDFYAPEEKHKRPKVFGMTASPVDAKVDVLDAAKELEALLHSRIATTSNLIGLSQVIARPEEIVIAFDPLVPSFQTDIHEKLDEICGDLPELKRVFQRSLDSSSELGHWPAELYWTIAFDEEVGRKKEQKIKHHFEKQAGKPIRLLNEAVEKLWKGVQYVNSCAPRILAATDIDTLQPSEKHFSSKVLRLHGLLSAKFERPTETRCIVFVERRHTARMLCTIFERIGTPYLKPGSLVGQADGSELSKSSVRSQVMTMTKFRRGTINCLFATNIAEEGLDIPDCNVVIRFDLYRTMIQYIQSRGRARHQNSTYYHFREEFNEEHIQRIIDSRQSEDKMKQFCELLPSDRKFDALDTDITLQELQGPGFRRYTNPRTGAKLTYGESLAILMRYVDSWSLYYLGVEDSIPLEYFITRRGSEFSCEVVLPSGCPVARARGLPYPRKSYAKRSAAFEACIQLIKKNELDDRLFPKHVKQRHMAANALLALNLKKTNVYPRMIKPNLWETARGSIPTELFLTVLDVDGQMERSHRPLGLFTRTCMPVLPSFPLYLNTGRTVSAKITTSTSAFPVTEAILDQLTDFTFRMYLDVFNKEYEKDLTKMDYWMAPLLPHNTNSVLSPAQAVDWETLEEVLKDSDYKWTRDTPLEFFMDKFLVDPFDGGRRSISEFVHPTLTAQDPVPSDAYKFKPNKQRTILEYSCSLYRNSAARRAVMDQMDPNQPVIVAEAIQLRRNYLAEPQAADKTLNKRLTDYVCPGPFRISRLPTNLVVMMLVLPAMMHRIEEYLIALEACKLVGIKVNPKVALEAVTKDSDNTDEHNETQLNFRRGMGNNYERLEFLGDCFLKMATSISLFALKAKSDEFDFHVDRMLLVCNQNLFETAKSIKLYEYIRSEAFVRAEWYPQGLKLLKGKGKDKVHYEGHHRLGDKTIADVCEALIGAAFLEHDQRGSTWKPENWDNVVRAVSAFVDRGRNLHAMQVWKDYAAAHVTPGYALAESTASQLDMAAQVELVDKYHFKYPRLLRSAFIHPSQPFSTEKVPSYQRLEFLGDALLDMSSVALLFYGHPDKDPQWLTEHKMAMVSNKFLGAVCVRLGFHRHLRHSHSALEKQIREYVTDIEDAKRDAKDSMDYWTSVKSPPKCLPDIVEAYVGAMFIDSGFNYAEVQRFFDSHIEPYFRDMSLYDTFANNHPTTRLHQFLGVDMGCQDYRLMAREMPTINAAVGAEAIQCMAGVMIHDRIISDGVAASTKNAKVKACSAALEKLRGLAPYEFRARFGCDCKWKGQEKEIDHTEEEEMMRVQKAAQERWVKEKIEAVV